MNKSFLIAIAAALIAAPLVMAQNGVPKNYCEPYADWADHSYGPVAGGFLIYGNEDGNLGGDCDPGFSFTPGEPCVGFEDPANPLTFYAGLCGADLNPPVADWDGHNEFAFGGAWILVTTGAGVPSADPTVGAGTAYCFGADGHHASYGPATVTDLVLGQTVAFSVYSDTVDLTGTGSGCGDFISDHSAICVGTCTVTFPPGIDGAYVVFVTGTAGHIIW